MIGLKGLGYDQELEIIKESKKAFLLKDYLERKFWLPKSAFDEEGELLEWGIKMLQEKYDNYEYVGVK